jgi:hypothetical protein
MVDRLTLRNPGLLFGALLCVLFATSARAQSSSPIQNPPALVLAAAKAKPASDDLPDAPDALPDAPDTHNPGGVITGIVADPHGAIINGARVTVATDVANSLRAVLTDSNGLFSFTALAAGTYKITITAPGFAPWVVTGLVLRMNEIRELPLVTLRVATASTDVQVTFTQHDLAEEQIHQQEKQRVFGVLPNFYVTYNWNAAPLTAKQKFKLAFRNAIDPVAFLGAGFAAGLEQWDNGYPGYGQGAQGYFKRMGASYTDAFDGTMLGGALFPSLLHQDPRYFYKGTGSTRSRILYAISTVVICKGDNGKWEPNYSNVLGSLAGAGISNLYYPAGSRDGATLTVRNALVGTASGAISSLFQEFLLKRISTGVPPPVPDQPVNQYQKKSSTPAPQ